jgi:putative membrane protein/putative copper resistance protein D
VLVLIALLFQWYASDQRQAKRTDRAADRDGDKELEAYNAYLTSLHAPGK